MSTMTGNIHHEEWLVADTCWCGIGFAMPSSLHRQFTEQGHTVFCPLGHRVVITKTEIDRLREEKKRLEARLVNERDQREATERSLSASKGQLTKLKKRIGKGVCPGCGRRFENVERHMASKHPEMAE